MTAEQKDRRRKYYLDHRDAKIAYQRRQYKKNAERLKAEQRLRWATSTRTPEQIQKQRERSKRHYQEHREENIQKAIQYHREHPEIAKKCTQNYLSKNRILLRLKGREYYRNNRSKEISRSIHCNHTRRARKLATMDNPIAIEKWIDSVRSKPFAKCHWCQSLVAGRKVHIDHVIPLSKGGPHTISNLCATCPDCNYSKSARLIKDWSINGQTFLTL